MIACFRKVTARYSNVLKIRKTVTRREEGEEIVSLIKAMVILYAADVSSSSSYHVKMLALHFFDIVTKEGLISGEEILEILYSF